MLKLKEFIYHFGRYLLIGAGIVLGLYALFRWFAPESVSIIFAIIVLIVAEALALLLSNLAIYVYTRIPFLQSWTNRSKELCHILGSIFIAVHLLVAIIMGLLYWGKI